MANTLESLTVTGLAAFGGTVSLPSNTLINGNWNPNSPLQCTNQQIQVHKLFAQVHGSAAAAERRPVHLARGAGTLVSVRVGQVVAATGDSTATVDVKKNGSTALSGTVGISSANAAYTEQTGSPLSSGAYVADDVFEVAVTVSAGTGTLPQGIYVELVFREANGG